MAHFSILPTYNGVHFGILPRYTDVYVAILLYTLAYRCILPHVAVVVVVIVVFVVVYVGSVDVVGCSNMCYVRAHVSSTYIKVCPAKIVQYYWYSEDSSQFHASWPKLQPT